MMWQVSDLRYHVRCDVDNDVKALRAEHVIPDYSANSKLPVPATAKGADRAIASAGVAAKLPGSKETSDNDSVQGQRTRASGKNVLPFVPGTRVRISKLVKATAFQGTLGTVQRYDAATLRYHVHCDLDGTLKSLKPEHVLFVEYGAPPSGSASDVPIAAGVSVGDRKVREAEERKRSRQTVLGFSRYETGARVQISPTIKAQYYAGTYATIASYDEATDRYRVVCDIDKSVKALAHEHIVKANEAPMLRPSVRAVVQAESQSGIDIDSASPGNSPKNAMTPGKPMMRGSAPPSNNNPDFKGLSANAVASRHAKSQMQGTPSDEVERVLRGYLETDKGKHER